jgi:hypothetical protein
VGASDGLVEHKKNTLLSPVGILFVAEGLNCNDSAGFRWVPAMDL